MSKNKPNFLSKLLTSILPLSRQSTGEEQRGVIGSSSIGNNVTWLNNACSSTIPVTVDSALESTAVLSAVTNLSQGLAQCEVRILKTSADGVGQERVFDHPLVKLLTLRPNTFWSAFDLISSVQTDTLLRGNGLIKIDRDKGGNIVALWHLPSKYVSVELRGANADIILYKYNNPLTGKVETFLQQDVAHIPGLVIDSFWGSGLIDVANRAIQHQLSRDEYGNKFFQNDTVPSGVLLHPGRFKGAGTQEKLLKSWNDQYKGLSKSHKTAIIEEGMDYKKIGASPSESQLIEGMEFGIQETSRIFNVTPHRLMDLSHASNTNISSLGTEFATYTLGPWIDKWEQVLTYFLFSDREIAQGFHIEFNTEVFMKGDPATHMAWLRQGIFSSILTTNEARNRLGMNPIEEGNESLIQLNMSTLKAAVANGNRIVEEAKNPPGEETGDGFAENTDTTNNEPVDNISDEENPQSEEQGKET